MKKYEAATADFIKLSIKDVLTSSLTVSDGAHDITDTDNSIDVGEIF